MLYNVHFSFHHNIASFLTAAFNTFTLLCLWDVLGFDKVHERHREHCSEPHDDDTTDNSSGPGRNAGITGLNFSKNVAVTTKSYMPGEWHEGSVKGRTHNSGVTLNITVTLCFLLGAWELIHVLVHKGKTAIIVLKVWCAIIQTLVRRQSGAQDLCMPAGNFGHWHQTPTTVEYVTWQLTYIYIYIYTSILGWTNIRGSYRKSWATFFCMQTGNSRWRRVWW